MTAPPIDPPGPEPPEPPQGWHASGKVEGTCRSCGADIRWFVHDVSGNPSPFDLDNTPHFATCPDAPAWRRKGAR